ncbi:hypothetical protein [Flavobacterium sp. Root420]|uniref:hypothetical protein n=1 Tax=Flavobacterium sp. Root420 TaxID=1736533 RepID=UPI000A42E0AF|nr:hypothetical protein [Flavobacterium sp. Root420]
MADIQNTYEGWKNVTPNNCNINKKTVKNIFLIIIISLGLNAFAQKKPNRLEDSTRPIYVFAFNEKIDRATYKKVQGITMITDFEIVINKKKVSFHSPRPLMDRNEKLQVNTTRSELEEIIKNDNINKQPYFYIFVKSENKYYSADYIMFRTIQCE